MARFSDEIVIRMRFATPTEDIVRRIDALSRAVSVLPNGPSRDRVCDTLSLLCEMTGKLVDVETELLRGEDAGS